MRPVFLLCLRRKKIIVKNIIHSFEFKMESLLENPVVVLGEAVIL